MRTITGLFGTTVIETTRVLSFNVETEAGLKKWIDFFLLLSAKSHRDDVCKHSRKGYFWRIIPNKDDVIKVIVTKYKFEKGG